LIRDIYERRAPLIGICFGHQIIAQAMGGKVEKFSGGWVVGRTEYQQVGPALTLNAWHQDQVTRRPECARVLASNDACENAILAYGDTIWTLQAHPEFSTGFIAGLIATRGRGVVPDDILSSAAATLDGPVNNSDMADFMATFFEKVRG